MQVASGNNSDGEREGVKPKVPRRTPMACQFCRGACIFVPDYPLGSDIPLAALRNRAKAEMRRSLYMCQLPAPEHSLRLRACVRLISGAFRATLLKTDCPSIPVVPPRSSERPATPLMCTRLCRVPCDYSWDLLCLSFPCHFYAMLIAQSCIHSVAFCLPDT